MPFTIEASDRHGGRTFHAESARVAIDMVADLLNAEFTIDRMADHNDTTIDYDDLVCARYGHWAG